MTDNSWIEWAGGMNPVGSTQVEVKYRNGETEKRLGTRFGWAHWEGYPNVSGAWDIIAYRIVTAADDRGDGNDGAAGVTPKPDELAIAVERVKAYVSHADEIKQGALMVATSDLRLILSRLASQEETIRADGEALRNVADCRETVPFGENPLDFCIDQARARLSARQDPPA